jgi:hypothetical protein
MEFDPRWRPNAIPSPVRSRQPILFLSFIDDSEGLAENPGAEEGIRKAEPSFPK